MVWDSRDVCFDSDIHFIVSHCKYTIKIMKILNVTANRRTMKIHFVVIANTHAISHTIAVKDDHPDSIVYYGNQKLVHPPTSSMCVIN